MRYTSTEGHRPAHATTEDPRQIYTTLRNKQASAPADGINQAVSLLGPECMPEPPGRATRESGNSGMDFGPDDDALQLTRSAPAATLGLTTLWDESARPCCPLLLSCLTTMGLDARDIVEGAAKNWQVLRSERKERPIQQR